MAKNDNLEDFLISIANAIRTKKGTTEPILAQDFETEITNIQNTETNIVDAMLNGANYHNESGTPYINNIVLLLENNPSIVQETNFEIADNYFLIIDWVVDGTNLSIYRTDTGDGNSVTILHETSSVKSNENRSVFLINIEIENDTSSYFPTTNEVLPVKIT